LAGGVNRVRRFPQVLFLLLVAATVFVGAARALDFNDESETAPSGEVGREYYFPLESHGGCVDAPYHYVVESGELPPGLTLSLLDERGRAGLVSGSPTEVGTWSAWIALKDHCGNSAELLFTFEIARRSYSISTPAVPAATAGAPYSAKIEACCHPIQSQTFPVTNGTLPVGATLAADGTISGTPMIPGTSTFTIRASSKGDHGWIRADSRQFMLIVSGQLTATLSRHVAEVGAPFRATLALSAGGPGSWSSVSVPEGIAVANDGTVSGTPTRAGASAVPARFTTPNGASADVSVPLTVHPRLAIVARRLPTGHIGHPYAARLSARGGVRPIRWHVARGHLPNGTRLIAVTGALVGTARKAASSRVAFQARDALGVVSTRAFAVVIR
jgi:hypothetical protein